MEVNNELNAINKVNFPLVHSMIFFRVSQTTDKFGVHF